MDAQVQNKGNMPSVTGARRWLVSYPRAIPLAIFLAIAAIAAISVYAIESNAKAREKAQLTEYAQSVSGSLERRGASYSAYLRAGAALFSNFDRVRPQLFRQFVAELRFDVEDGGTEGIGWIEVIDRENLSAFVAQSGLRSIRTGESQTNDTLAIVTEFAPNSSRNSRAIGFDMMSDPSLADAIAEAARTVKPTASTRVGLAPEGVGTGPGIVIFMPVYRESGNDRQLSGFIYTPIDAATFLSNAIDRQGATENLSVRLYDGEEDSANLLFSNGSENPSSAAIRQPVSLADREVLLVVENPEIRVLTTLSMVTMLFGLAVASLLMLLARLLARQAYEDQARLEFFEEQNSIRNSLTRELNHRVKNTLANVLSILSLTRRRTDNLDEFADSLDGRIRALSATHDLLTHSDWGTIPVVAVIEAELQHFRTSRDHPITIEGPDVELAPNDALSFGLAMHELATNAAKFGALSVAGGSLSVTWSLIADHLAEVVWCERGGPAVADMRSRGFGTELIEKIVAHELRNPVDLDFQPEGVRCVMRVPVRRTGEFHIRQR